MDGWIRKLRRHLRRALGRGARRAAGAPSRCWWSPAYRLDIRATAHDPYRSERILGYLLDEGWIGPEDVAQPPEVPLEDLRRVHADTYLNSLGQPEALLPVLGFAVDERQREHVLRGHRAMTGGTLEAARWAVRRRGFAVNLGGGFHHALPERGQGYCLFHDVAVAVAALRANGFQGRVLVVDLDLHDGEGTRAIFAEDASVFTLSIHNRHLGPVEARASFSLALGEGVGDAPYLEAVQRHVAEAAAAVSPELVFYLAGVDPAEDDVLGDWRVSAEGIHRRDRWVVARFRRRLRPIPMVWLLAGGYGTDAWRHSARSLAWALGGATAEPPATEELTLARFRALARTLGREFREAGGGGMWSIDEADLLGDLGAPAGNRRLLGVLTREQVELALERAGILERIRRRGYLNPVVDLDLEDPDHQRIRVYGGPDRAERLVELQLRKDRSTLPGRTLLRVEWLLLQDPRASFPPDRPPLPGQKHPGLGLLHDVVALLVVLCEQLGLDGLTFTPSHYHLAVQSRKFLRFLDPRHEMRFQRIRDALSGVPLAEATRLVEEGRVLDPQGRPVRWEPAPMVLPVRRGLREQLGTDGYRRAVEQAREEGPYRLATSPPSGRR